MSSRTPAETGSRFHDLDRRQSEEPVFKRRNLPHLEVSGATYFVTFRSKIVLAAAGRDIVLLEIQRRASREIDLVAAVVMPDHAHLIFRLVGDAKLSQVLQLIKGRTSKEINRLLMRRGALWIEESFDRVIRNETDLEQKIEYIKQNPVKKGLVTDAADYRWLLAMKPEPR